jgi:hypothetical protein
MNAWHMVSRVGARIEAAEAQLLRLREELAGWEALARTGDEEVGEDEAAKLGLLEKNSSKNSERIS